MNGAAQAHLIALRPAHGVMWNDKTIRLSLFPAFPILVLDASLAQPDLE